MIRALSFNFTMTYQLYNCTLSNSHVREIICLHPLLNTLAWQYMSFGIFHLYMLIVKVVDVLFLTVLSLFILHPHLVPL